MKVGDKVRIKRAFTDEEFPKAGWHEEMDLDVGGIGTITNSNDGGFNVRITPLSLVAWTWPAECLELVADDEQFCEPRPVLKFVPSRVFRFILRSEEELKASRCSAYKYLIE